ncbi:MAG: prepilin-type N-terminal cleavage/methylation domain-containing protein, partial [Candidatus Omnitrophica bacterium]|nr:prepilin-type N-terminal cleavage/methylation domain-containing protein [Candidatus Omnitrophota bacterium]
KGGGMRRGFTLLEILIVVIIIAILATLAMTQYMTTVERARGAEVKQVFGHLRQMCAVKFMEDGNTNNCDDANLSIGTTANDTPSACRATHHFSYAVTRPTTGQARLQATRCIAQPAKSTWRDANRVNLTVDYAQGGVDTWANPFGY